MQSPCHICMYSSSHLGQQKVQDKPDQRCQCAIKVIYLISTQHVLQFSILKNNIHKIIPIEFHSSPLVESQPFTKCRHLPGSGGSTEVLELAIDTGSVVEKQLELPKDGCLIPKNWKSVVRKWDINPIECRKDDMYIYIVYIYMFAQYI